MKKKKDQDIKKRWENYFCKLFNGRQWLTSNMGELESQEDKQNLTYYHIIQVIEVKKSLKTMENGKVANSNCILIEVWECVGE